MEEEVLQEESILQEEHTLQEDEVLQEKDIVFVGEPKIIRKTYISLEMVPTAKIRKRADFVAAGEQDSIRAYIYYNVQTDEVSIVVYEIYNGHPEGERNLPLWKEESDWIREAFADVMVEKRIAKQRSGKFIRTTN